MAKRGGFPGGMPGNMNNLMKQAQRMQRQMEEAQKELEEKEVTAKAGIKALRNFLKSIGMPGNFAELGASENDIEHMAHTACYGNGGSGKIGGFAALSEEDVANIYRLML